MRNHTEIQNDIETLEKAWDIISGTPKQNPDNIAEVLFQLKTELETCKKYWQHWSLGEKLFKKLYTVHGPGYNRAKATNTWSNNDYVYEFDVLNEAEQIPFINAGIELEHVL